MPSRSSRTSRNRPASKCGGMFDSESTKTVGLAEAIVAEKDRPRCDVFWNNDLAHAAAEAAGPFGYLPISDRQTVSGGVSRCRGLLAWLCRPRQGVDRQHQLVGKRDRPTSILDLADPKWRGRGAMAKPLFGTTATHAACLFAVWGDRGQGVFPTNSRRNDVQILSGNKQVAGAVGSGRIDFGLTDTDDAWRRSRREGRS